MIGNQPGPDHCPAAPLKTQGLYATRPGIGKFVNDDVVPGIFRARQWREAIVVCDICPGTPGKQQVDAFKLLCIIDIEQ